MKIPFCKPTIGRAEIKAVKRILKSGWLAPGKEVEAFEKEFAEFVGIKYAIFTNSGTSALKMAFKWFKEQGYSKFIAPVNTFCATRAAGIEMGLKEVSEDVYEVLYYRNEILKVNVHYGGIKEKGKCDLEDSAHRIEPNDPLTGKIRIYSFYVTKNMTTGSGGMLITNDKNIYERCRLFWRDGLISSTLDRNLGNVFYQVKVMSGGYDGNDLQAAIGRVQLKKLPKFNKRRNEIVEQYNEAFGINWKGNHLYPYKLENIKEVKGFIEFMKEKGINCSYHYPGNIWTSVSLPLYPSLTKKEVNYIIKCINEN